MPSKGAHHVGMFPSDMITAVAFVTPNRFPAEAIREGFKVFTQRLKKTVVTGLILFGSGAGLPVPAIAEITSTVTGVVVPARAWDVSAEVSNKINRLHFVEGQVVAKGDLLVEFDTGFKELELALAEAQLNEALVAVEKAQEDFVRQQELKDRETVSEAQYQEALFALRAAQASAQTLRVQSDMAASLLAAQKLYAPFSGQMSSPNYRENANVNINRGREVATLVQLDPIHVRAPVPLERVMARLLSGQSEVAIHASIKVGLVLPDGSEFPYMGKIVSASFGLNADTEEAVVLIEFPNPDHLLRPGMEVVVTGYEN